MSPRLYDLLPQLYRVVDAKIADRPLEALTATLDAGRAMIAGDIAALYEDWFVETARIEALPLLGTLVGLDEQMVAQAADPRGLVAAAVALARGKGTRDALERALRLLSGWPVRASMATDARRVLVDVSCQRVLPLRMATPCAVDGGGRYRFHPMGFDVPLYAWPDPAALSAAPRPLGDALCAADDRPAITILRRRGDGEWWPVPFEAGNLAGWSATAGGQADRAIVDPVLGRFLLAAGGDEIAVSVALPWEPGLGDGTMHAAAAAPAAPARWLAYVTRDAIGAGAGADDAGGGTPVFASLGQAIAAFAAIPGDGTIRILDSAGYDLATQTIDDGTIVCPADPDRPRRLSIAALDGETPCLRGTIDIIGKRAGIDLSLHGCWIDGRILLRGNARLRATGCTVHQASRPTDHAAIVALPGDPGVKIEIDTCLVGPIDIAPRTTLIARGSVIDGYGGEAIGGDGDVSIERSTVLGSTSCAHLRALDALFGNTIQVGDAARGSIQFSTIPEGSITPEAGHCVPTGPISSTAFPLPSYARLGERPPTIATGASDGGEIGVGHALSIAERVILIERWLDTSLPIGLEYEVRLR